MDNELDFSTKIGMIEVQKKVFPNLLFLFFEGGLGEGSWESLKNNIIELTFNFCSYRRKKN